MSADVLRAAAALMRTRAEATKQPHYPYSDRNMDLVTTDADWRLECEGYLGGTMGPHCAFWSPVVALAVADWLDDLYERITDTDYDEDDDLAAALRGEADVTDWPDVHRALAVARAYLGESA